MLTLQARLASSAALRMLYGRVGWTVLQVHRDVCNLGAEPDHLVALVRPEIGAGPFSIVVELPSQGGGFTQYLAAGDRAELRASMLSIGDLRLRLEGAAAWEPRPAWEALRGARGRARWLQLLSALLRRQAPSGSLADSLDPMLRGLRLQGAVRRGPQGERPRAVAEAGNRLALGLAGADLVAASTAAGDLAGLGPGLTPAGDDFLVGAMLALWSGVEPVWAQQACGALLGAAAHKTNRISRAWLRAAARGQAAEAWHALVLAMTSGEEQSVRRAGRRILQTGHTSGADALTGYVVVLSKTAPAGGADWSVRGKDLESG